MLKVGLVGVGGISSSHISAWLDMKDAQLTALCDIRPEQMEKYPDIKHYTDIDVMLENEKFDILDICVSTYLHADISVKALEKGINVLCEKPICLKREDVERVYAAAEKNSVKFMVAQVIRFWREYEYLRAVYQNGRYGKLISGTMSRISTIPGWSWNDWMRNIDLSGFLPYDLHIHDLDFIVYTFGKPKKTTPFRILKPDQDFLSVVYEFDDFIITAESGWFAGACPFSATFRFQFEDAVIAYDSNGLKIYERCGNVIELNEIAEGDTGDINLPKSDGYANEINYFADCVRNDLTVEKVKKAEIAAVMDIVTAI